MSPAQRNTDIRLTQISLALTAAVTALLAWSTGAVAWTAFLEGQVGQVFESMLFSALAGFLVYGNCCYQVARLGRLKRANVQLRSPVVSAFHFADNAAPALTILVPSYKEEIAVIRQALLSAALQDYPKKRVVLLLDDPPNPKTHQDCAALWAGRNLPFELQTLLQKPADYVVRARTDFLTRRSANRLTPASECVAVSDCLIWAAEWFETQAKHFPSESHTDLWFVEEVLTTPAEACRAQASQWFAKRKQAGLIEECRLLAEIDAAYTHLVRRFRVEFDVFERKQYCNLSHEPNKAMNLNSYLGLMGKCVRPVPGKNGVALSETPPQSNSRLIPDTPYVITLDADSLLMPQYASTLVRLMEQTEHACTAVAQTPYSAFPNPPSVIERTAGATTDIQYLVHQGFTQYGATFWVGANALLRKSALEDICVDDPTSTGVIRRYIQDRTVIEDTESTVDLLAKGWTLHNHPERLAYSATPSDFGSLTVQRARWANGGLLILPKLLGFLLRSPKQLSTAIQAFLQVHYLTSLAFTPLSVLLLLLIPFSSELITTWMPLAALPYFVLYARDLSHAGYRPMRDLLRVYALNLLLIPVHLGGALKSMQQAIVGTRIPFRRTPKISGRTSTPPLYLVLEGVMVLVSMGLCLYFFSRGRWISGSFALVNACLVFYGVHQFIGFAELKEDLVRGFSEWVGQSLLRLRHFPNRGLRHGPRAVQTRRLLWDTLCVCLVFLHVLSPRLALGNQVERQSLISIENQKAGTADWVITRPARRHEIEGYATAASVNRGETIGLFINTTAPSYRLSIYRMGWYGGFGARQMLGPISRPGREQPAPYRDQATGLVECHWKDPFLLTIPSNEQDSRDWLSGYYLVKLTAEPNGKESYVLFVIRDDQRPSTYLVQSSVITFQAYNNWGGASLYDYNSPSGRAVAVSFNRPYAVSPEEHTADAAGAGPFLRGWEYNMVRWLERSGYDVTYTTDVDVHERADLLQGHRAFLVIGHDEYWTWAMRRRLEEARASGVHLGFFSANTGYWQVRLEPSRVNHDPDRTIVAYKEGALANDPLLSDQDPTNDHLATTKWRSAPVNQPEASLIGSMYLEGTSQVDGDLVVEASSHWIMNGTGLERGARLPGLLGYEVDGIAESSPAGTTAVTRSPVGSAFATSTVYTAQSGAVVFNAGSMQWIWGLDDYRAAYSEHPRVNTAIQSMTQNILKRFRDQPTSIEATEGPEQ